MGMEWILCRSLEGIYRAELRACWRAPLRVPRETSAPPFCIRVGAAIVLRMNRRRGVE